MAAPRSASDSRRRVWTASPSAAACAASRDSRTTPTAFGSSGSSGGRTRRSRTARREAISAGARSPQTAGVRVAAPRRGRPTARWRRWDVASDMARATVGPHARGRQPRRRASRATRNRRRRRRARTAPVAGRSRSPWRWVRGARPPVAGRLMQPRRGHHMELRRLWAGVLAAGLVLAAAPAAQAATSASRALQRVKHIVVIYEENHSFDNLYGGWEGVRGRSRADAAHTAQVNQVGARFTCLLQNDVNLTAPAPLPATCTDTTTGTAFASHFRNRPFVIDRFITPADTTCPQPGASAPN